MDKLTIWADKQRIEQVLFNLISNAVKYSQADNRVVIHLPAPADNKVRVSVQDFGMGIAPHHQQNIFSRFYRAEELSSHISGLGIGLYISYEIIKRHQGRLWVNSKPGEGSTFFFEIPVGG